MMKSPLNFLSDEPYVDLIELCIVRNDKFVSTTFISEMMIADRVKETCMSNQGMSNRFEIFPPKMGDECPLDSMFFDDGGDDGDD